MDSCTASNQEDHKLKKVPPVNLVSMQFVIFRLGVHNSQSWWRWSGPGTKAPVALQPLGLLYTLFSRSSHCRRQIYARPTRREKSKQREVEIYGREIVAENFA
jgi:hypothetical protein